ncbi:hypothetical protein EVAR_14080_1 [Eumeta japonica]|uniref:Uncharacterized protein n=1 Tax=Eumeta variegata TaxID=151549 RepID=A0A4C1UN74_EUMVA|nr:hypothetical protein EVAR_14080_1 [Eumeta japonica]
MSKDAARTDSEGVSRAESLDAPVDELANRFDGGAAAAARRDASKPSTHDSATRQVVSGKLFKKCKSATFQIDGATYTIVTLNLCHMYTRETHFSEVSLHRGDLALPEPNTAPAT